MAQVNVIDVAFAQRCEQVVLDFIYGSDTVMGCVAWLTNPDIVLALSRLHMSQVVVTADSVHNRRTLGLTRAGVRQIGAARGRFRSLMHHKFLVRLTNGRPSHV